jgi:hypothetical protein
MTPKRSSMLILICLNSMNGFQKQTGFAMGVRRTSGLEVGIALSQCQMLVSGFAIIFGLESTAARSIYGESVT